MTKILNHLEESTNTAKSKQTLTKVILISVYLLIWAISIIAFWFFTAPSDAMGYSLLFLWLIQPASIFTVSLISGIKNCFGKFSCVLPLIAGVMYMLCEYATFSMANNVYAGRINVPHFEMLLGGAVVSAVGLVLGLIIHKIGKRKAEKAFNPKK